MAKEQKATCIIESIQVGRVGAFGSGELKSAIYKRPVSGSVYVGKTGLEGDEVAEPQHHGGTEMAVHQYPREHYDALRAEHHALETMLTAPGAFGENISAYGMTEDTVFIGDIYRVGEATLQVSQGRQPCWKLSVRFELAGFAEALQKTGRTGWYYRVLVPGKIEGGDAMTLVERPNPEWSIDRVQHYFHREPLNYGALEEIAQLKHLAPPWQEIARTRVQTESIEDWHGRLIPPSQ